MSMGGGENYPKGENEEGSISSEQNETNANTSAVPSGLEKTENPTKNTTTTDKVESPSSQKVSTDTVPVSSPSVEASKPKDTTVAETPVNVAQETQVTPQQNWEYEQSIRKETEKTPLVCLIEDIQNLYQEYEQGSEVYRQKIMKLAEKHNNIRRCRGDGNCFYRAFGFAWFERLMDSKDTQLRQSALSTLNATMSLLDTAGYQKLVYEDTYEYVEKQMKAVANGEYDQDMLLTIFQTDEISNYIVYYLRLITAAYLKLHHEEYEPFLEFEIGMEQFCSSSVEVMDQEADHIHVTALTKALKVPVEVAYMSGSDAMEQVNFHEFYSEEMEKGTVTLKPLVLLYRPGHYDILYRRE